MKICMITPFRPERDGVGDCSVNLVPELLRHRKGLKVVVISRDIGLKRKERGVYRILYKKSVTRNMLLQLIEELRSLPRVFVDVSRTLEIIRREDADIVHVQHEPGVFNLFYTPLLFLSLKFSNRKKVLTLHGRDYSLLKTFHNSFLYPLADLITVHTDAHKEIINEKNVVVIPMGINKISGSSSWKFYNSILFFGFISPHKGLEYLLAAFRKVLRKLPDAQLMINGPINPAHREEVEYQKKIMKMVDSLGISKNTKFISKYVEREELPKIKSDIVIFPYKKSYSAGQSAALLDSIAAGKAVIVTKIPGIYERIASGKNGLVVEPENSDALAGAILKLLGNKNLLRRICKNNSKLVTRGGWGAVGKILLKTYDRLLRGGY